MTQLGEFDLQVRYHVYDVCLAGGKPPAIGELSDRINAPVEQIQGALVNLADAHMLVLQKANGEILMANPFSAVPTPFVVETPAFFCYGNCIWDSLGIAAMLHQDVRIRTSCADCGSVLELQVTQAEVGGNGIVHFAIPARRWWEDIVFT